MDADDIADPDDIARVLLAARVAVPRRADLPVRRRYTTASFNAALLAALPQNRKRRRAWTTWTTTCWRVNDRTPEGADGQGNVNLPLVFGLHPHVEEYHSGDVALAALCLVSRPPTAWPLAATARMKAFCVVAMSASVGPAAAWEAKSEKSIIADDAIGVVAAMASDVIWG